jgi:hypothetical protein
VRFAETRGLRKDARASVCLEILALLEAHFLICFLVYSVSHTGLAKSSKRANTTARPGIRGSVRCVRPLGNFIAHQRTLPSIASHRFRQNKNPALKGSPR